MSIREQVHALAEQLSGEATWKDVAYEIYVRQAIERGIEASKEGRLIPAEQAKAYLTKLRAANASPLDDRRA
ncbi:hypothetical protein QMK33_04380 [Hymenobacter sp. H14-R3]|uniref:hypothetical protein n=1 Tax=Hymenobacter sp. H14-R3 TaxID=3046308 RepID=UPI0024B8A6AA|nr:hypothetical protein [Hymenobacter sp. H14-R3]MDJ0364377.1 hypothetical protein [Hymenobacter sp. H14-R3]